MTARNNEDGTESLLYDSKEVVFHLPHLSVEEVAGEILEEVDDDCYVFVSWQRRGVRFTKSTKEVRDLLDPVFGAPSKENPITLMRVQCSFNARKSWLLAQNAKNVSHYLTRER